MILLCCSLLETKATVYEKADIAICADLSYSTKGLLDALRQNMWYLMHYLTVYSPQPNVRIGMMCYGKIGFGISTIAELQMVNEITEIGVALTPTNNDVNYYLTNDIDASITSN